MNRQQSDYSTVLWAKIDKATFKRHNKASNYGAVYSRELEIRPVYNYLTKKLQTMFINCDKFVQNYRKET